jgi:hypothetical protein
MIEMLMYISYILCAPGVFLLMILIEKKMSIFVKIFLSIFGLVFLPTMLLGYMIANIADKFRPE